MQNIKEVNTFEEIMNLIWEIDTYGCYWLSVIVNNCHANFWIKAMPADSDRGHWLVICESFFDKAGVNTIDECDYFPRMYMNLEIAKEEIQRFIAWRALHKSEEYYELIKHNITFSEIKKREN